MCFFPFLAFSQLPLMDLSSNPENIKKFRLFFLELSKDHRKFSVISCVNTRDHRKFSVISCLLQKKHSLNFLIFSVLLDRSIKSNCLIATEVHFFLLTRMYRNDCISCLSDLITAPLLVTTFFTLKNFFNSNL